MIKVGIILSRDFSSVILFLHLIKNLMKYLKRCFFIYETETGADFFMTLMLPTTLYDLEGGTGGGRSCRRKKKEKMM